MLRLTKSGKRKYVSLGLSVKEKDWDFKKNQPKKACPDREAIVKLISDKVSAYNSLIMELTAKQQEFTMSSLVQMIENKVAVKTVSEMYDYLIDEFRKTDHLGTMSVYQQSKSSLTKFNRTLDIPFSDIDCQWLERYEKWLKCRNIKDTTISILFRTLRSVFNRALSMKLIKQDIYPFNDFKQSYWFIVAWKIYLKMKINVPGVPSVHVRGQAEHEGCSPISGRRCGGGGRYHELFFIYSSCKKSS